MVYTGEKSHPATLKLSDAYEGASGTSVEVTIKIITKENVHNTLGGYIYLVQYADRLLKQASTQEEKIEALHHSIKHCIENRILSEFLKEREMEVADMIAEKFDYKTYLEVQIEEAVEEAVIETTKEVTKEVTIKNAVALVKSLKDLHISSDLIKEQLIKIFNITENEAITFIMAANANDK